MRNRERQFQEIADVDTDLLEPGNMQYPFGCWLTGLPDDSVTKKFYSLPMGDLFSRGWRLAGRISLSKQATDRLLRFIGNELGVGEVSSEFVQHAKNAILTEDPYFANSFHAVRAVVFDVSFSEEYNLRA